jgi:hypothetical protein
MSKNNSRYSCSNTPLSKNSTHLKAASAGNYFFLNYFSPGYWVGLVHTSLARIQSWPTVEVISSRSPSTFRFLVHGDGRGLYRHESREVALTVIYSIDQRTENIDRSPAVDLLWVSLSYSCELLSPLLIEMVLGHHAGGSAAPGPVNGDSDYNVQPRFGVLRMAWARSNVKREYILHCLGVPSQLISDGSMAAVFPRRPGRGVGSGSPIPCDVRPMEMDLRRVLPRVRAGHGLSLDGTGPEKKEKRLFD